MPVLPVVDEALLTMRRAATGPFLWTLDGGRRGASYSAAAILLERVALAMVEAGETLEAFTLGDLPGSARS